MKRRAFSIIELFVVSAIFLSMVGVTFGIFEFGTRASMVSNSRHNLQAAATRAMLSLQNDLRRSSYATATPVLRTLSLGGQTVQRDGLCFAGIANWSDASALNTTLGTPSFNRFFLFYATQQTEGRLIRSVIEPSTPMNGQVSSFTSLDPALHLNDDPSTNSTEQKGYTLLAHDVVDFAVRESTVFSGFVVSLTLQQAGTAGPTGGTKRMDQRFQMEFEVSHLNTNPRS